MAEQKKTGPDMDSPASNAADTSDAPRFEAVLSELETVVEKLERGSLPLAEALEAFERGMTLSARADKLLSEAEARVDVLVKGPDGADTARAFGEVYPDVDLETS